MQESYLKQKKQAYEKISEVSTQGVNSRELSPLSLRSQGWVGGTFNEQRMKVIAHME